MPDIDYKKLWLQACKAYDTKNPSGCVCNIDEDASEVRSPCMLHKDWLENAVAAEREACAVTCESEHVLERIDTEDGHPGDLAYNRALQDAARTIRERSNVEVTGKAGTPGLSG